MAIKSLDDINKAIRRNTLLSLLVLLFLSLLILNGIYFSYYQKMQQQNAQTLASTFNLLKSNLSEKLSIAASSNIFIDYLRSGQVSRQSLRPDFLFEVETLRSDEISGMKIYDIDNKQEIFSQGIEGAFSVTLPLCYLDRELSSKLGYCGDQLVLYLNPTAIVKNLKKINDDIVDCKNCQKINFLEGNTFGSFPVLSATPLNVSLKVQQKPIIGLVFLNFFVFSVILILAAWTWQKTRTILDRHLSLPLRKITENIKAGKYIEASDKIDELTYLVNQIHDRETRLELAKANEKVVAVGLLASQVAHDIRSPLAALNAMIKKTDQIPEQQRIMIRNAAQRINDIANNLLAQYQPSEKIEQPPTNEKIFAKELISALIDRIVSEKRAQFQDKPLAINFYAEQEAYGVFAEVSATDFKTAISNLINNAVEAISKNGIVAIYLKSLPKQLCLEIRDNGCGMTPELQKKVLKGGVSIGKEGGTGIGLVSAKRLIKSWGGKLALESQVNEGTIIRIFLPKSQPADWFLSEIVLFNDDTVIILDDDQSIHDIWDSRFEQDILPPAKIKKYHYQQAEQLLQDYNTISPNARFFVDYELNNSKMTGLDLIKTSGIASRATLVTSRDEELDLRAECETLGIKILPKAYAIHVPIIVFQHKPDLIFIDDDKSLTDTWKFLGELRGKQVVTFNIFAEARTFIFMLPKETPIYIDSELSKSDKGEILAKQFYDLGYQNLYLVSGHPKEKFLGCYWLKDILGKEPPF